MFNVLRRKSDNLAHDKGTPSGPLTGGGPGVPPGHEEGQPASAHGDMGIGLDHAKAAAHHTKMAAFHRSKAGPIEGSPEEEAGELPEFEATEDEGHETQTPPEAFGGPDEAETPEEAAGETPESEIEEGAPPKAPAKKKAKHKAPPPPQKKGQSAFNSFRKGGY